VVVSIGGDNFSDDYGSPEGFFRTLDAAKRCGARTVIWGASIGPFSPPEAERKWARYLAQVDLITAREAKTGEYLAGLGITKNVQRVCDPAFLLPAVEPRVPVPLADSSRMRVGIGMSALMHKYGAMEAYLDAHVGLVNHVISKYGADIVLVPHVIREMKTQNDFAVCEEVSGRIGAKSRCYVLPQTLNACELKYCISKCDYFIGARTHSTIAALSTSVPTISIGYSVKAWGINDDLLGSCDYVLDIQTLRSDTLIAKFEQLHGQHDEILRRLRTSVPHAEERAERAGEHLLSLIHGANGCRR
jgi:polysaccharide pyruvyl transferase WcaK-like protein